MISRQAFALLAAAGACGPSPPREVRGPGDAPPPDLAPPATEARALLITAEPAEHGGHLVVLDESGRRQRNLTPPPLTRSADFSPAISPDGRWVVFASSRDRPSPRETSLWIVPAAGGELRRLTDAAGVDVTPAFAPGGHTLAFGSTRSGDLDVWTVDLDDAGQAGSLRRITTSPAAEYQPVWSRAGDRMAWTSVDKGAGAHIVVAGGDGGDAHELVAGESPEFSPDGGRLVYAARQPGRDDLDLHVVALGGGPGKPLVDHDLTDETGARFTADGHFLLATSTLHDERRALFVAVICVDLDAPNPPHVLLGALPIPRLGIAVGPGPVDTPKLRANPTYREAVRRALVQ